MRRSSFGGIGRRRGRRTRSPPLQSQRRRVDFGGQTPRDGRSRPLSSEGARHHARPRPGPQPWRYHAAGILGNIGHECRGFLSLQEIRPIRGGRGGWGWCQWTNDRRQEFEQWANERNLNLSSDEANYGFLLHELQGSQKASLRSLKQAPTVDAATTLFMHAFEKPAEEYAGVPDRLRYAKLALQDYRG